MHQIDGLDSSLDEDLLESKTDSRAINSRDISKPSLHAPLFSFMLFCRHSLNRLLQIGMPLILTIVLGGYKLTWICVISFEGG